MKILFVTYTAYPSLSGRIAFLSILKKSLEKIGHQVDILAHASGLNEIFLVNGKRVEKNRLKKQISAMVEPMLGERYPNVTPWIKWRETERYTFEAAIRQFDLSSYDLIHVHDILSSLACHRVVTDKPIVASFHNCKVEEWKAVREDGNMLAMEMAYIAREEYLSIERSDRVTVPSRWLQEAFSRLSVEKSKMDVVPYGMEVEEFQRALKTPTDIVKPGDRKVLLCPARLVPIKGHTYLLQALELLQAENCRFECWIAGSGVLEMKLKQEVANRSLTSVVRFLGERKDIPSLMAISDLVVLPTLHDTSPLVIMEAQLAGIPVISTTAGGVPEMVKNGKTGLIGPPRDPVFLFQAIRELLCNPIQARKMTEAVLHQSHVIWDINRIVAQTEQIYHQVRKTYQPASKCDTTFSLDERLLEPVHSLADVTENRATGRAMGTVCKPTGEPLRSATVHLSDISQVCLQTELCNDDGYFFFSHIPTGKYSLTVTKGGRSNSQQLIVQEGEVSICHVVL